MLKRQRFRILALAAFPGRAAATRFRLLQYRPALQKAGIDLELMPFIEESFFDTYLSGQSSGRTAKYIIKRAATHLSQVLRMGKFDAMIVQREASMFGPPLAEGFLSKLHKVPLAYDFDDALWIRDFSRSRHPLAARVAKWPSKYESMIADADVVFAGSDYLAERAKRLNRRVLKVPTVVPAQLWQPLSGRLEGDFVTRKKPIRLGWIGTHSTADQLQLMGPALRRLHREGVDFELVAIGSDKDFSLSGVPMRTKKWSLDTELNDFQLIDIGLGPMRSGGVYEGKCGFKQLQYMAVGVPMVTSLVGGARDFVRHEFNALVCNNEEDWYAQLQRLIQDKALRARLAKGGRQTVEQEYCAERVGPVLVEQLLQLCVSGREAIA